MSMAITCKICNEVYVVGVEFDYRCPHSKKPKDGEPSAPRAPGETALDLEALAVIKGYRDIAEDLLRKAINIANEPSPKWYKDSDAKISAIKGLAEVWDQDVARMRARLRSTPGAQESRPQTEGGAA